MTSGETEWDLRQADVNRFHGFQATRQYIEVSSSKSYREGKAFHFDGEKMLVSDGNASWAQRWEKLSKEHGAAKHIPGWKGGDIGSSVKPNEYQKLAGPWIDGVDPAANVELSAPAPGKRRRNKARS